jgi:hypothetical protein
MKISKLVKKQKDFLSYQLETGFRQLSDNCSDCIDSSYELNKLLSLYLKTCKYAQLVYMIDMSGIQISANVNKLSVLAWPQTQ